MDGTLVPTRDHTIAEQSKNYRYSTDHQVPIDADTRLIVTVGQPVPGNRNDCKAWEMSGAKDAVGRTTVIADGGYRGTGLVVPHRRERGQAELPAWKEEHNTSHRKVRARVEHAFARMKGWMILRDCRLKGAGVHHAMLGIARLHCSFAVHQRDWRSDPAWQLGESVGPERQAAERPPEEVGQQGPVPEDTTLHDLRHFYASVLIKNGATPKQVQMRLGHAKPSTLQV